jgi:hypothetical protein
MPRRLERCALALGDETFDPNEIENGHGRRTLLQLFSASSRMLQDEGRTAELQHL